MKPLFTTTRLELSAPILADLSFLYSIYEDQRMMAYLGGPLSQAIIRERLDKWQKHWEQFGFGIGIVRLKSSSERVGVCGLFHTEIEGEKVFEIGWMISPTFQQRGIAFEAAKGYLEHGKTCLKANMITAFPNVENLPSNRILENLGFKRFKTFQYQFLTTTLDTVYWRLEIK